MKKNICLTLLLGFIATGFAQQPQQRPASQSQESDLQAMVETERAFAKMSQDQGTRPAFVAFIAEDGILFRPTAVKGKEWMAAHPLPPTDKRPLLSWYPTLAGMARAGDMGYTTGPWEYKSDIHDAQPVAWGNFLTVWKRQADGQWKFAIDLGISNPQPTDTAAQWELPPNYKPGARARVAQVETEAAELRARDQQFSSVSALRGAKTAFDSFVAADVRLLREEKFPFIGKTAAVTALPASSSISTWEPAFADVSRSGDLGYSYGTYRIASKEPSPVILESGNYYRIWKKEGGVWLVLFDLTNPIPPETKKN